MTFTIPGDPYGKGRHRTNFETKQTYTPKETVNYEALVKLFYQQAADGFFLGDGIPVRIRVDAYYQIPKSVSKKKLRAMLVGQVLPTKKPDWDNIGKIICDALNGIAYKDDAQVVDGRVVKHYSEVPHTDVTIEEAFSEDLLDSHA